MQNIDEKRLINKALSAMENAYAPYSNFPVGACEKTSDGEEIIGCNIENASYGLSMCAERVTLFKAYSEGKKDIVALAVAANVEEPVSPCGACRQVISELAPIISKPLLTGERYLSSTSKSPMSTIALSPTSPACVSSKSLFSPVKLYPISPDGT